MYQSISEMKRLFMEMDDLDKDFELNIVMNEDDLPLTALSQLEDISFEEGSELFDPCHIEYTLEEEQFIEVDIPMLSTMNKIGLTHFEPVDTNFSSVEVIQLDKIPIIGWQYNGEPVERLVMPIDKYNYVEREEVGTLGVHSTYKQHDVKDRPVFAVSRIKIGELNIIFNIELSNSQILSALWTPRDIMVLKEQYVPSVVYRSEEDHADVYWSVEPQVKVNLMGCLLRSAEYTSMNLDMVNCLTDLAIDIMGEVKLCPRERLLRLSSTSEPKVFLDADGREYRTENRRPFSGRRVCEIMFKGDRYYYKHDTTMQLHSTAEVSYIESKIVTVLELRSLMEIHPKQSNMKLSYITWTMDEVELANVREQGHNVLYVSSEQVRKYENLLVYLDRMKYTRATYYRRILDLSWHRFNVQRYYGYHKIWVSKNGRVFYITDRYRIGYKLYVAKARREGRSVEFAYYRLEQDRDKIQRLIERIREKGVLMGDREIVKKVKERLKIN